MSDLGGYLLALYRHQSLAEDITVPFEGQLRAYRGFTLAYCTNSRAEVDDLAQNSKRRASPS
jgi:hypothetical protein